MASTPSASALSAVLRCRGKIWTRNPPTKRPAASVCSLGLSGGALRDPPAERTRSNQASAWEAFLRGERVVVGRRLAVACESTRHDKDPRGKDAREINKLCHAKLSQSPGDAHSGVQSALVRQLARRLTSNLPGINKCSQIIQMVRSETYAAHICKIVFVQEISEFPAGALKVSVTSPRLVQNAAQIPSFVLSGWSTLKSTCLCLTALVSEFMLLKLAVLCRSSSSSSSAGDRQQDGDSLRDDFLQVNGQIHSPTVLVSTKDDSGSGQTIMEDRPD